MLHFNGLEPIDFHGKEYMPKVDAEKRLRLSTIKFNTTEETTEADTILCSCFEEQEAKEFIIEKLSADDKQLLATYLIGGETAVNRLSNLTDGAIEKYITRMIGENNG